MTAFKRTGQAHHSENGTLEESSSDNPRDSVSALDVRAKGSVVSDQIPAPAEAPSTVLKPGLILFSP